MGRLGITYEEVELAAEKLLQQGDVPTIERIRTLLSTGSNSTISKYLNDWKKQRLRASVNLLPPLSTPSDPVNEAVKKVWQQLAAENESKIQEIQATADAKIQEASFEKEQALAEKEKLAEDSQHLRELLKEERLQNANLEKEVIDLRKGVAVLEATLEAVKNAYENYQSTANNMLEKLTQQQETLQIDHEEQRTTLKKVYEQQISDIKEMAENQRHKFIVDIDHLKTANQQLQNQAGEKDLEIKGLSENVTHFATEIETLSKYILQAHREGGESQQAFQKNLLVPLQYIQEKVEGIPSYLISQLQSTLKKSLKELKEQLLAAKERIDEPSTTA